MTKLSWLIESFDITKPLQRITAAAILLSVCALGVANAQPQELKRETFLPPNGKGAVVVVVSGLSGVEPYRDLSANLAKQGYYTVLVDGNDVQKTLGDPQDGARNLKALVTNALSAPEATSRKAALVGFSLGGAGVLLHGAKMKEQVSAVVAYYPATVLMGDLTAVAASFAVPVLLLAGEQDKNMDCCLIGTMRTLQAAPKTTPFELVVFPGRIQV
jgi:dienelactone hydrolase